MRTRTLAAALTGVALAAGQTLAQHKIACSDTQLLAASGYPGLKRSYRLRGFCKLYAQAYEYDTYIDGTSLQTDKKFFDKLIGGFVAEGKAVWDGKSGKTQESLVIEGTKLNLQTNCIKDPFIEKTFCSGTQVAGDVGMKILTAIYQSKQPVFARSVTAAEAQALSAQAGKGGGSPPPPPPPPPKPKITVPRLKVRDQPAGGGPAKAKPPAFIPLAISPTPIPTRPGGRRLRLPTPTPTPAARRGSGGR